MSQSINYISVLTDIASRRQTVKECSVWGQRRLVARNGEQQANNIDSGVSNRLGPGIVEDHGWTTWSSIKGSDMAVVQVSVPGLAILTQRRAVSNIRVN